MADFETLFDPYRTTTETLETLFTIIIHHMPLSEAISTIDHRLQLAKEMKASKKKSVVCHRLFNFKQHLENLESLETQESPSGGLNEIFLIGGGGDEIIGIPLKPA